MSLELKRRIKTLADAEERTMAKWCAIKLKQIVEDLDAAAAHPPLASLPPAQKQPAAKSIKRA